MEKIPTFIEFKKEVQTNPAKGWTDDKCAVEFAKLHVEAALKEASEKARLAQAFDYGSYYEPTAKFKPTDLTVFIKEEYGHGDSGHVAVKTDKDSILNSYPLTNIK